VNKCKVCNKKISKYSILGYCKSCSNKFAHKRGITKHYCINCKINEISLTNFLYGKQRCIACAKPKINPMKGKKRPDLSKRNRKNRKYPKKYCPICHKKINHINNYCKKHYPHPFKNKKRPKHSKIMTGKNNPSFVHGNGRLPYPMGFNKKLKSIILKRDNFVCQKCNQKGNTVHHIDYNPQNIKKSNLITVCDRCNKQVNFNRDYWYAYFKYIMECRYDL